MIGCEGAHEALDDVASAVEHAVVASARLGVDRPGVADQQVAQVHLHLAAVRAAAERGGTTTGGQ